MMPMMLNMKQGGSNLGLVFENSFKKTVFENYFLLLYKTKWY